MDPITAVGAVASILQLAQTALTLSTTLYGLGSALLSASEDLKSLADDLKTFSQSLTLLSRLLEDSKSWYSDDIYLLTAKVIKDCADLYVRIDGILSNLGSKGKASWMKRVKYVMKESQIRKLLSRLRDLKGTLATILMSLQVDLQLSLLNISSSSKLQRAPEVPLQPSTIQTLRDAQEAVRKSRLISVQATKSDVHVEEKSHEICSDDGIIGPSALVMHSNSILMFQRSYNVEETTTFSTPAVRPLGSLKSASSSDSFKSAVDQQEPDIEIIREVEGVLHAFRTALEVLEKVKKRIDEEDKALRIEADMLNYSLIKGLDVDQAHGYHYRRHGVAYLRAFHDSQITIRQLQEIMAKLMGELVTTLHMYSAAYEVLSPVGFQKLFSCSEECRIKTLFELDRLAMLLFPQPLTLIFVSSSLGSRSEPLPLKKSEYEVHISEYVIDSRLSAKYDYLLGSVRSPDHKESESIRGSSSLLVDEGLHGTQPVKPSIDKVSGSLWGKFNKFVAGEDDRVSGGTGSEAGSEASSEAGPLARIAGDIPIISRSPSNGDLYGSFNAAPMPATAGENNMTETSKVKKSKAENDREADEAFRKAAEADAKKDTSPVTPKKGWGLGGWFSKKEAASDGAQPNKSIKAKLGEESSFVYDPELKRWINKKASKDGAQEGSSATPPPRTGPPRSVNSSPAMETTSAPRDIIGSAPPQRAVSATATSTTLGQSDGPPALAVPLLMATPMSRSISNDSATGPPSGPLSRPTTSMSYASSLDDLLGPPTAKKGSAKKPKKGRRYIDIMEKAGTTLGQSPHQHMSAEQVRGARPRVMAIDNCLREISRPGVALTATAPGSGQGRPSTMAELSKTQTNRDTASDAAQPSQVIDDNDWRPAIERCSRGMEYFSEEPKSYFLGETRSPYVRERPVTNPYSHLSDEDDVDVDFTLSPLIEEVGDHSDSEVVMKTSIPKSRGYSSSTSPDSPSPRFKVQTPSTVDNSSPARVSEATHSATPRTSASSGSGMTALSPIVPSFGGVNLSDPLTGSQYDQVGLPTLSPEMLVNLENNNPNLLSFSSEERWWNSSRERPLGRSTSVNSLPTDNDEKGFTIQHYVAQPAPSLVQAKNQPERLWRLAYTSLNDSQPDVLHSLKSVLSPELDFDLLYSPGSVTTLTNQIGVILDTLSVNQDPGLGLGDASNHKKNIIKVIGAVSGTLGLENSIPAWWCVTILLKTYEPVLSSATDPSKTIKSEHLDFLTQTFPQLSDIVSMIARYAVMENLYHQNPTMTLRADYRAALLQLCCKIFEWFASAFKLANAVRDDTVDVPLKSQRAGAAWEEIKQMDQACQKFTVVVVEVKEEDSESEDGGAETPESEADDVEDVSDEGVGGDDFWGVDRSRKSQDEKTWIHA